jgi:hypothetical protein
MCVALGAGIVSLSAHSIIVRVNHLRRIVQSILCVCAAVFSVLFLVTLSRHFCITFPWGLIRSDAANILEIAWVYTDKSREIFNKRRMTAGASPDFISKSSITTWEWSVSLHGASLELPYIASISTSTPPLVYVMIRVSLLSVMFFLIPLVFAATILWKKRTMNISSCRHCGYDIVSLASTVVCPECGLRPAVNFKGDCSDSPQTAFSKRDSDVDALDERVSDEGGQLRDKEPGV